MSRLIRKRSAGLHAVEVFDVDRDHRALAPCSVVALSTFIGTETKAKEKLADAAIKSGLGAIDRYRIDMGHYPRSEDGGLRALIEKPSDEQEAKKWAGPYVGAEGLKDPWGNEYIYEYPGRYNEGGYDLSSPGADGQPGNDDDITNWKVE